MTKKIVKLSVITLSCAFCFIASVVAQEANTIVPAVPAADGAASANMFPLNIQIFTSTKTISPTSGELVETFEPFSQVKGVLIQDSGESVEFVTNTNGNALINVLPSERAELVCEDTVSNFFGSEEIAVNEALQSGQPIRLLLNEQGLSRLSDDFDPNGGPEEISPVEQTPTPPMAQNPAQPYSPYSGSTGGSGWWALAGLAGLSGLVGLSDPEPVSPSK